MLRQRNLTTLGLRMNQANSVFERICNDLKGWSLNGISGVTLVVYVLRWLRSRTSKLNVVGSNPHTYHLRR